MRHAVTDLGAFGVVEPIHRTDEVARDAPDALELHALAHLAVYNRKRVPFIFFHFYITMLQIDFSQNVNKYPLNAKNLQMRFFKP